MIAESNRLPRSTRKPACAVRGRPKGRITASSRMTALRAVVADRAPVGGEASARRSARAHQLGDDGGHAAGTIKVLAEDIRRPAADSRAAGCRSRSSASRRWKARRRCDARAQSDAAARWSSLPSAEFTRIALMKASRVRMSDGLRSASIISTICRPFRRRIPGGRDAAREWQRIPAATCPAPRRGCSWSSPCPSCCSSPSTARPRRRA